MDEVVKFSTPSCASDVKSFLGMASFFRKFISDFSVHAAVLSYLSPPRKNMVRAIRAI